MQENQQILQQIADREKMISQGLSDMAKTLSDCQKYVPSSTVTTLTTKVSRANGIYQDYTKTKSKKSLKIQTEATEAYLKHIQALQAEVEALNQKLNDHKANLALEARISDLQVKKNLLEKEVAASESINQNSQKMLSRIDDMSKKYNIDAQSLDEQRNFLSASQATCEDFRNQISALEISTKEAHLFQKDLLNSTDKENRQSLQEKLNLIENQSNQIEEKTKDFKNSSKDVSTSILDVSAKLLQTIQSNLQQIYGHKLEALKERHEKFTEKVKQAKQENHELNIDVQFNLNQVPQTLTVSKTLKSLQDELNTDLKKLETDASFAASFDELKKELNSKDGTMSAIEKIKILKANLSKAEVSVSSYVEKAKKVKENTDSFNNDSKQELQNLVTQAKTDVTFAETEISNNEQNIISLNDREKAKKQEIGFTRGPSGIEGLEFSVTTRSFENVLWTGETTYSQAHKTSERLIHQLDDLITNTERANLIYKTANWLGSFLKPIITIFPPLEGLVKFLDINPDKQVAAAKEAKESLEDLQKNSEKPFTHIDSQKSITKTLEKLQSIHNQNISPKETQSLIEDLTTVKEGISFYNYLMMSEWSKEFSQIDNERNQLVANRAPLSKELEANRKKLSDAETQYESFLKITNPFEIYQSDATNPSSLTREAIEEHKWPTNLRDKDHNTLLHLAVANNDFEMVNFLKEKAQERQLHWGRQLDAENRHTKETPLTIAIKQNNGGMVKWLVKEGATVDNYELAHALKRPNPEIIGQLISNSNTKLYIDETIKKANLNNPTERSLWMNVIRHTPFAHRGALVNAKDVNGNTLLHAAVKSENLNDVEFLLTSNASTTVKNNQNESPLELAKPGIFQSTTAIYDALKNARNEKLEQAQETQERITKLSINMKSAKGNQTVAHHPWYGPADQKEPQLHAIIRSEGKLNQHMFQTREDYQTIHQTNAAGYTPLHYAAAYSAGTGNRGKAQSLEMIKFLVENNADVNAPIQQGPNTNDTALHIVVELGDSQSANYLLSRRADPNLQNARGETPLHLAARNGDAVTVKALLEKKPNPANSNIQNNAGETALHIAARLGNVEIVSALMKNNADPSIKNNEKQKAADLVVNKVQPTPGFFTDTKNAIMREKTTNQVIKDLLSGKTAEKKEPMLEAREGVSQSHTTTFAQLRAQKQLERQARQETPTDNNHRGLTSK